MNFGLSKLSRRYMLDTAGSYRMCLDAADQLGL